MYCDFGWINLFYQQDSYRTGLFVKKNHFHMHCVDIDSVRGCELHLRNIVLKDLKEIHYAQKDMLKYQFKMKEDK